MPENHASKPLTDIAFSSLDLLPDVQAGLTKAGFTHCTPIQALTLPPALAGRDVAGQAQTGTGKTAAFALPLLSRLDLKKRHPQILVLTPTRELALQVSEAIRTYARHLSGFQVLPVYGGQSMSQQLRQLHRGVHAVVGTPGRVLDHLRRNTLNIAELSCVVLDEADEMLRMGFIDDVEEILKQAPTERQTALFSATMPKEVNRIAQRHLNNPIEIKIKAKTSTVETIVQRFWQVKGLHKLDALTRVLEIGIALADALAVAHAKGIVHRDLKPANIMVGRFGEVYVMDWGLAKVLPVGGVYKESSIAINRRFALCCRLKAVR